MRLFLIRMNNLVEVRSINDLNLLAHPLFLTQYNELLTQVEKINQQYPAHYKEKNSTKRLAVITKLIFEKIPEDPTLPEYRLGSTHWQ
jgi:toxin YhaV